VSNKYLKRKFPRHYSIKRKGYRDWAADIKKIRELIEREGPCGYTKIRKITGIKRGALERRLNFMKDLGEIVRSERRRWILTAPMKKYKTPEEYKIHHKHSMMLVRGMLAINEFLLGFCPLHDFYSGDILTEQKKKLKLRPSSEMGYYALQHIQTGYPDVFEVFERCSALLDKVESINAAEQEMVLEKVTNNLSDIQSQGINEDLSSKAKTNIDKETESTPILKDEERFKLEEETNEARFELEHLLTELILKVLNGEPLSGICYRCPKVTIGEKSAPQKDSGSNH